MKSPLAYRLPPSVKDLFLCLLSAVFLTLSFPKFDFWLFAWFGLVPLFYVLENKPKGRAFIFSYFTGIIFWSGTIYWLVHVTLPGTILLILYLALYFGIFGLIFSTLNWQLFTISLLFIPSAWALLEYIRSYLFTGFPWALLGYSQYLNLPAIQAASITGAWGISFLVMLANALIYSAIRNKAWKPGAIKRYTLALLFLIFVLSYGRFKLSHRPPGAGWRPIRVSVLQGNIPQELKWEAASRDFIINKYFDLTKEAAKSKPDIIIWPEAAFPEVLEEDSLYLGWLRDLAKEIEIPLLLGAVTLRQGAYYNSAILISHNSKALGRYDKLHLVPFGEYIPAKNIFPFLETVAPIGDITAGKEYTILRIPDAKPQNQNNFAVLVCFEDLFPELSREFVKKGAGFLVNITNDAWYKKTSAGYQHLQASVFRAVENRVFLVRSANTGVSGMIAPDGKIISLVSDRSGRNIFVEGIATRQVGALNKTPSFYTRHGDIFILLLSIFYLYGIFRFARFKSVT